jgi:hypothetical protein
MGCICSPNSDAYLACAGIQPIYTDAQVSNYSMRVGATGGNGNWIQCYSNACLRVLRVIYWKNALGDCGNNVAVAPNTAQILGGQLKAVAVSDPEPISKAVIGILGTIAGFFGAGHAKAVANEQKTLCAAMQQYNALADALEKAISSGALNVADALQRLQLGVSQIQSGIGTVSKPTNFGFGMNLALEALQLFNKEVIYPQLTPANQLLSGSGSGTALAVGAGIVGAKVLGVF